MAVRKAAKRQAAIKPRANRRALSAVGIIAILDAGVLMYFLAVQLAVDRKLHGDQFVAADDPGDELRILSAGSDFDSTVGVPDEDVDSVRAAAGTHLAAVFPVEQL